MKIPKPKKSSSIKQLRSKADGLWQQAGLKKWGNKCFCGKSAYCCHHYFIKSLYGHLRYDIDNAVPICNGCHFAIHTKQDVNVIMQIRHKRGEDWYKKLQEKSKHNPMSYKGINWYKNIIIALSEFLGIID